MKVAIYYPSWSSVWAASGAEFELSKLDSKYIGLTCVYLAFAKPDMSYVRGSNNFNGTGIEFAVDFNTVVEAIKLLKSRGVCVMLSVGGGSYWSNAVAFNAQAVADLCADLGANGVDLDYEVPGDGKGLTSCILALKPLTPGYISFAGWSTGAYANDGGYSGMAIDAIINAGDKVDAINLMAYDAGADYKPQEAFNAYKKIYNGCILMGFETGNPGWGGYVLTQGDVDNNVGYVKTQDSKHGIFVWCDKKDGSPGPVDVIKAVGSINIPVPQPLPTPVAMSIVCPVCSTVFKKV